MKTWCHPRTGIVMHLVPGRDGLAPFWVGRAPVRQEEWDRVGGDDLRAIVDPDLPVVGVSWNAAVDWLARAGDGLRLPSEAEWEHACRAGSTTAWWWGDAFDPARCWSLDNAGGRPHAIGEHEHAANAWGLIDMAGNVSEWCQDERVMDPAGGDYWQEWNPGRVHRGGSWDQPASKAKSGARGGCAPEKRYPDLGLRAFRSV